MLQWKGVYSVLPTPFTEHGDIDHDSLRRVIDRFIADGVTGLTALGVTSEVARLNDTERGEILDTVIRHVDGRVPIVAGATADGLRTCLDYARLAQSAGAAALMVSPPRAPKLRSEAVRRHFHALAEAVDRPIVIQDYPLISGYSMEPWLLVRIAREVPSVRAIKLEDAPTPFKTARIREEAQGLSIGILGGLGGAYLLEELLAGADGAMTGFAYPRILVEVVETFHAGRLDEAAALFYRYAPLMRFEFQQGIGMAIRKEMLKRRGLLQNAAIRPPGLTLDGPTRAALDRILGYLKL